MLLAGKADAALDVSGNLEVFFQIEASCAAMLVGNLVARLVLGGEEGTLHCLWRGGLLSLRLLEGEQQDEIDAIMTAPPKTYRRRVKLSWMATGWQRVGSSWYWLDASGAMGIGWLQQSARWYYLKASGAMAVGWQKVGSAWYWFDGSGAMASSRWVGDYYLGASGAMVTSQWVGAYYVGADGKWVPGYGRAPVTPASDFEYKVGDFDPREFSSGSANYYPYVELPGYGVYITGYKGSSQTVRLPQETDGVPVVYADLAHTGDGNTVEDITQIDVRLCNNLK